MIEAVMALVTVMALASGCGDDEASKDNKKLQKQLDVERQGKSELQTQVSKHEETLKVQTSQIQDAHDRQVKSEEEMKRRDDEIIGLRHKMQALDSDKKSMHDELTLALENEKKAALKLKSERDELATRFDGIREEYVAEIDGLKKQKSDLENLLKDSQGEEEQLRRQISAKDNRLKELEKSLADLDAQKAAEIALLNASLQELNTNIATIEATTSVTINKLNEEISVHKSDAEKLKSELTLRETQIASLSAALGGVSNSAVAVNAFLAHAGKDSLFVVEPELVSETYHLPEDHKCTFIFSINPAVEIARGSERRNIPRLRSRTMLPLKVGYQKIALCHTAAGYQAHVEQGSIYQSAADESPEAVQLVTSREKSSCEGLDVEQKKNVFSSAYQLLHPYRGDIDGIETVDLFRGDSSSMLRYHMASATFDFRGSNCSSVIAGGLASDLSVLICKLALGLDTGVTLEKGCFTEQKGEHTTLMFNK
jgi:predicted  nucleic acid-binding Zn-ribbon protein